MQASAITEAPIVDPKRVPRLLAGSGSSEGLSSHVRRWGPMNVNPASLIDDVDASGLTGRGGARFPTAVKLASVAQRKRPVVVANGTEGEPASAKDKMLMINAPHLILDGASAAARAVGATKVIICVDRAANTAALRMQRAIDERSKALREGVTFELRTSPTRYVTGEESALVNWINGGDAKPTFTPPRPYEKGVGSRPTLVDNVETLANIALIARFGPRWFRQLGTVEEPGTMLTTVSGSVASPGVYEVPLGTPIADLIRTAHADLSQIQAVLLGGYFGTWLPATTALNLKLSAASVSTVGAALGCGAVAVISRRTCGLAESARVTRWMAAQSAMQCGPCANGLPAIAKAMDALVAGDVSGRAQHDIQRWTEMISGRGACHHPDGTVRFVASALSVFRDEIKAHRAKGPCRTSQHVLPTPAHGVSWR